jgi:3,4-dihydroxy 2-butanone 4-phosphate synthase/GTP cyclohydrolase II
MNEDGSMARLPQLVEVAKKFDLKLVPSKPLVAYRMQHDSLIVKKKILILRLVLAYFKSIPADDQ